MSQAMLKLEGITKDYKVADTFVHALKGVDLRFRRNEFVSILGPSGCGKTTLLNIIGGLDHYTEGDLVIKGISTKHFKDADWDAYRNHSIGFVFQSYNLIPHQSVLGNVELALTLSGVSPSERKERATRALERVGLGGELNKKPNQLSGGQMQRVAIARALVNDPEILLADEPTGALDTETSVQIMELIKEIAGERLVIMVTHNPDLAEKYSTRIVRLLDGRVVDDTDPFDGEDTEEESLSAPAAEEDASRGEGAQGEGNKGKKGKKKKTSMSFWTAFLLSGRNLLTKKGRTAVTSVAGSIGIISVCLVLALSNGFSGYITKTEEDMLSYYPLQVTETSLDITAIMSGFNSASDMPDLSELDNKVYVNSFLTQIAQGMTVSNDINQNGYLDYVYNMNEEWYYAIQQDTGVTFVDNIFTTVTTGRSDDASDPVKTQVMSLSSLKEYFVNVLSEQDEQYRQLAYLVDYLGEVVNVMPGTGDFDIQKDNYSEYVLSQYDVLAGNFPQSAEEAVLVIGSNNDLTDLLLAQLGYIDQDTFLGLFELGGGDTGDYDSAVNADDGYLSYTFEQLMAKPYTLFFNDEVYAKSDFNSTGYVFEYNGNRGEWTEGSDLLTAGEDEGIEIKISGILRLKDGLTYGCLSDGLNLTEQLVNDYIQKNMQSEIVQWMNTALTGLDGSGAPNGGMLATGSTPYYLCPAEHIYDMYSTYYTRLTEKPDGMSDLIFAILSRFYITSSTYNETVVRALGGDDTPNALSIYPRDFSTKDDITAYLDAWNDDAKAQRDAYYAEHGTYDGYAGPSEIKYTDTVGLLMGMVQTILDAITYVLIAFTGISLIVSTVMIGVITYVSVVERTKEIGVLRAIGARRKDIKRVFNAETFIIGLCAGLFGIGVAYVLQVIINLILTPLTGISGLAALPVLGAFIMVVISVALTLISGLIPASAAAKKDPVIALRSE